MGVFKGDVVKFFVLCNLWVDFTMPDTESKSPLFILKAGVLSAIKRFSYPQGLLCNVDIHLRIGDFDAVFVEGFLDTFGDVKFNIPVIFV